MNELSRPGLVVIEGGPERSFGITRPAVVGDDVVSSMATGPWVTGLTGLGTGGGLGVLIDDVLGFAIMRDRPAGLWSVSAEISLDLFVPVPTDGGRVEAKGRLVHAGPDGGSASGAVIDASGRLIAQSTQHGRWITSVPEIPVPPAGSGPQESTAPPVSPVPPVSTASAQSAVASETRVPAGSGAASLATLLGARIQATEGGSVLDLPVTAGLENPLGNLHGGITLAACDLVAQSALHAAGGPTQTASLHVTYPRPIPSGSTPRFEARVVHRGRVLGIAQVTATLDGVKPCALATVTTTRPT